MRKEIILAGIGGRGVLVAGEMIARAGMKRYEHVSFMPSYFSAMRGGLSECTVILSDRRIGSPLLMKASTVIVIDPSQIDPFLPRVKEGGNFIVESTKLERRIEKEGINVIEVPALDVAVKLGGPQGTNMVLLGFYVGFEDPFPPELLEEEIRGRFSGDVLSLNLKSFEEGVFMGRRYHGV